MDSKNKQKKMNKVAKGGKGFNGFWFLSLFSPMVSIKIDP